MRRAPPSDAPRAVRTRGKTAPGRLAALDLAMLTLEDELLRSLTPDDLVIDLGFSQPWTTVELQAALARAGLPNPVVGVEIDADRVAWARREPTPGVEFRHGGFTLPTSPGERVGLIRAMNVLRSYPPAACISARHELLRQLTPGGALVEGSNGKRDGVLVAGWWRPRPDRLDAAIFATDLRQGFHPRMFAARLAPDQRDGDGPLARVLAAWGRCVEGRSGDARRRFEESSRALAEQTPGVDLRGLHLGIVRMTGDALAFDMDQRRLT